MGSHGLSWRAGSTEVERVSCQARLLGVKPGWSISSLEDMAMLLLWMIGINIINYQRWCKPSKKGGISTLWHFVALGARQSQSETGK